MERMLVVTNPSSTRALFITISSSNPKLAANIANEYAAVASEYISQTMDTDAPRVLSTAIAPNEPNSPNKTLNMLIGSFGSLLLSLLILLVSYLRNDKIVTDEDIFKYTGVTTLVVIPDTNEQVKKRKSIFHRLKLLRSRGKRA
jgi:capsular polysaccharide biosynthesis protein